MLSFDLLNNFMKSFDLLNNFMKSFDLMKKANFDLLKFDLLIRSSVKSLPALCKDRDRLAAGNQTLASEKQLRPRTSLEGW